VRATTPERDSETEYKRLVTLAKDSISAAKDSVTYDTPGGGKVTYQKTKATWGSHEGFFVPLTAGYKPGPDEAGPRFMVVGSTKADPPRMPTFYAERFTKILDPTKTNAGVPQGPHTVAHVLNEAILEQYTDGKKGASALLALQQAFTDLIRPPQVVEDLVHAVVPDFHETSTGDKQEQELRSGLRGAVEAYRQQYGLMIERLNKIDPAKLQDKSQISLARTEMSALLNMDPAGTYGWDQHKQFGKTGSGAGNLAGKGEGPAMARLVAAGERYRSAKNNQERTHEMLQMAKEFNGWLLDCPTTVNPAMRAAIDDIQTRRIQAYLSPLPGVAGQVKAEFGKPDFQAWVSAEKVMRDAALAPVNTAALADAILKAQRAYEKAQIEAGVPPTALIVKPGYKFSSYFNQQFKASLKASLNLSDLALWQKLYPGT
jgi:hypothetical protein